MNYSFSTVLMTILTSNLLIAVIVLCFRNRKIMLSIGYKLVAVFLILTVLRFLFPFEVPFSRNIYFPQWLSFVVALLRYPFISFWIIRISAWTLFGFVWLAGTLYFFRRHYRRKELFRHFITRYGQKLNNLEPYRTMMAEICGKRRNPLWVVTAPYYGAPLQYGTIWPYIVIPSTMDFSDEEIYYILRHETAHYYRHDALLKDAVGFLRAIYWWNPLCSHLVSKTDILLEMRVDEKLIKGDEAAREAYCRTLDRINEEIRGKESVPGFDAAISVANVKSEDLEYRQSMMRREKKRKGPLFYFLAASVLALYICSYCFTLEAYITMPWHERELEAGKEEHLYAVPLEDGTYDIYWDDHLTENVDTLDLHIGISIREK
ncbi:MAG: M56 family metallopeptidase [Acetatifactor sp.]|nr:M56 family metallopeptidase [Acetatifactor sp.]